MNATLERPTSDDATLMAAVAARDESACAALVRDHSARLYALAARLLRNEHDAADAVQDALISAVRRADTFRGDARLSTWLHRITVNACLMRRRSARPTISIDHLLPTYADDGHRATPTQQWDDNALGNLCREETRAQVRAAIDRLPDPYRDVLLLRDIDGLDGDTAAASLNITVACLKIRLHRARAALRELLVPLATGLGR